MKCFRPFVVFCVLGLAPLPLGAQSARQAPPAQTATPPTFTPPKSVELKRPDYRILGVNKILKDGAEMIGVNVSVQEKCGASSAIAPYVSLEVKDPATGKMFLLIGGTAVKLVNGQSSDVVRLNFPKGLPQTSTLRATINPQNKIKEASSANNFFQIQPGALPLSYNDDFCDPAKWE
jgi:hypothetical protein